MAVYNIDENLTLVLLSAMRTCFMSHMLVLVLDLVLRELVMVSVLVLLQLVLTAILHVCALRYTRTRICWRIYSISR